MKLNKVVRAWPLTCVLGLSLQGHVLALDMDEEAALDLQMDAVDAEDATAAQPETKTWLLTSELGAVHVQGRQPWPSQNAARMGVALRGDRALSPRLGLRYAARVDAYSQSLHAFGAGLPGGTHRRSASLQELYALYAPNASTSVQLGRINVREGSAYSFNPVDVYRMRSVKMFVNPSPLVTRESRQGTFGLRYQWSGAQQSFSALYSPKLDSPDGLVTPSKPWGLDAALTNPAHSVQLVWSQSLSEAVNAKLIGFKASDGRWQLGSSGSALLSESVTMHYELATGRMASAEGVLGAPMTATGKQSVLGATWTVGQWSWTLEHAYNSLALSKQAFSQSAQLAPLGPLSYLAASESLQTTASRQQWFLYVSKPDLLMPRLDLKAFVRLNPSDDGFTTWLELRRRFDNWDLSYQWLRASGHSRAMAGIVPNTHIHQIMLSHYY